LGPEQVAGSREWPGIDFYCIFCIRGQCSELLFILRDRRDRFPITALLLTMKIFILLSTFIVGCVVHATPLTLASESSAAVLTKTAFSTSQEDVVGAIRTAATSRVPRASLEKLDIFQILVFCSEENCSGDCQEFFEVDLSENLCLIPIPVTFLSVFIDDPSDDEFPFQVGVAANTNCTGLAILPEANVCFNVSPFGASYDVIVGSTEG